MGRGVHCPRCQFRERLCGLYVQKQHIRIGQTPRRAFWVPLAKRPNPQNIRLNTCCAPRGRSDDVVGSYMATRDREATSGLQGSSRSRKSLAAPVSSRPLGRFGRFGRFSRFSRFSRFGRFSRFSTFSTFSRFGRFGGGGGTEEGNHVHPEEVYRLSSTGALRNQGAKFTHLHRTPPRPPP